MRLTKQQSRKRWREVRDLWCEWDPIRVTSLPNWPHDEYGSYPGPTLRLLESGASLQEISAYLTWAELEQMGLSDSPPRVLDASRLLPNCESRMRSTGRARMCRGSRRARGSSCALSPLGPANPLRMNRHEMEFESYMAVVGALIVLAIVSTLWVLPIIWGVRLARQKGYSPAWMWFGIHPVTGWIAFAVLRSVSPLKECPRCAEKVKSHARVCPYCLLEYSATDSDAKRSPSSATSVPGP